MNEAVELNVDESNELSFMIKIEGAQSNEARVRLVLEGDSGISYMFAGRGTNEDGVVTFKIPSMEQKLAEGTYNARVEVLVESRYFEPTTFKLKFNKPVKVVSEGIVSKHVEKQKAVTVTAQPIHVVQRQTSADDTTKRKKIIRFSLDYLI